MEVNVRGKLYNLAVRTQVRAKESYDEGYLRIIWDYEKLLQEYLTIRENEMEAIRATAADIVEAIYVDNNIEKSEQS